jgi:hypothetical protein
MPRMPPAGFFSVLPGTETPLRTYANPLSCAAAVEPDPVCLNIVHIVLIRDAAIDSFAGTGNHPGLSERKSIA